MVTLAVKLKDTPWKESYDKPREHIKKADISADIKSWTIKKAQC